MGDDKDNKGGIGFSGISSLLPDEPAQAPTQQQAPDDGRGGSRPASNPTQAPSSPWPSAASSATKNNQPAPRQRSGAIWAWVGIAVVVFVIWAASQSGTQPSSPPASQSQVAQTDSSTQQPTPAQSDQENTTSATTQQPDVPSLQRPPVGSGNIFSVGEIRYCLVLKQWVEGAQPVVDTYSQDQVDRFNRMVNDYNGRCHDFRYQTGDLEQAKRDIAPYTQRFQTLSRQWVKYGETPSADAQQSVAQAATRTMVGNAQRALNTLGYHVGRPDGIAGARTLTAVKLFQRQNGLTVDGLISAGLVDRLLAAAASHPGRSQEQPREAVMPSAAQSPVPAYVDADRGSAAIPKFVHARELGGCSPEYPLEAVRLEQFGVVKLAVRVGSDGGVTAVQIVSSSGYPALDRAAVDAMEQCRFAPATRDGRPVVDRLTLPITFTLSGAM